jgi:FMN phosphatase YigB (HAD superfamily)/DNA-binding XRE family transcriptional regulator
VTLVTEGAIEPEKALGKLLQEARKKAGLTQQELCQKAELSYSTLAKIERGAIQAPSIFTIQRIASALGVGLNELVGFGSSAESGPPATKMSKSGISFVYFDINGCLVRFFHRAFSKLSQDTDARADVIESTFWHYNDAVCRGEMSVQEFNEAFAKRLSLSNIDWQRYYLEAIDPIEEMQELATWAAQHYKVGLLSNIMPGFIEAMMRQGLLPRLDYAAIVDSSKVQAIKPEPEIYDIAQQQAGVPANQILLIDDSRANVMAAEKLGWKVLWFDDFRPQESVDRVRSTLEI